MLRGLKLTTLRSRPEPDPESGAEPTEPPRLPSLHASLLNSIPV